MYILFHKIMNVTKTISPYIRNITFFLVVKYIIYFQIIHEKSRIFCFYNYFLKTSYLIGF